MSTSAPTPYTRHTPAERPKPEPTSWAGSILAPVAAAVATICAATSLTGVISGWAWLGYAIVAVVLVACTGLALRTTRLPVYLVSLVQLAVLACLVTAVFTRTGLAAIIPGPAALDELRSVLGGSFEQIRTGLPPIPASPQILCLVTIAIGLVAILVDTLAVAAAAPAATGLVLLCVYAVPASLSDTMMPWWTFVLGAVAFAGLLAIDGNHRHRNWRTRDAPGLGGSVSSASVPVAIGCVAVLLGLTAGAAITGVGTVGRLPGSSQSGASAGNGGLGVQPFTSLRGMLQQGDDSELFRVRGLGQDKHLLRAFTLDTYRPNEGWGLPPGPMPAGVPAGEALPPAPGDDGSEPSRQIQIDPVNWADVWLPVYGAPRGLHNLPGGWFYDRASGAVFNEHKQRPPAYTETAALEEPSKQQLRAAKPNTGQIPPVYTASKGIDPRVSALAKRLTQNATTNFDKANAIWRYFTGPNGFSYDTRTAAATDDDALADFLFNGKRGYCEQFASAMGVMLRSLNIPSRVAVGFTSGYPSGDYRSITSQDAHAWVEVYFGDLGWVSFDPTPLSDGRGYVPEYLRGDAAADQTHGSAENQPRAPTAAQPPTDVPNTTGSDRAAPPDGGASPDSATGPLGWLAAVLAVLACAITGWTIVRSGRGGPTGEGGQRHKAAPAAALSWLPLGAAALWLGAAGTVAALVAWWLALLVVLVLGTVLAPWVIREVTRDLRLRAIGIGSPVAAEAAWRELRAECADRQAPLPSNETVRATAYKVAQRHHLDEDGKAGLRTLVGGVERSWYGPEDHAAAELSAAFAQVRLSLRRNAPTSWRERLLPRSLLHWRRAD